MTETAQQAFTPEFEPNLPVDPLTALSGFPMLAGSNPVDGAKPWLSPEAQRRVAAVAGVAIACTSVGTVVDLLHQAPQYEGKFTLNPAIATVPAQGETTQTAAAVASPTVASPTIDTETQTRVLRSPRYINPVVEQLQSKNPDLSYTDIVDRLEISIDANQQIEVRYRDDNPETVQQVLEQLAQSYVAQSQTCQDSRCRGIQFIEAQLPVLQQRVQTLRQQLQTVQQQNGSQTMQAQVRLLTAREAEVARQKAQLEGNLVQARQQYVTLQRRMTVKPGEAIADQILKQNPQYQSTLSQFRQVNTQIAQEFGRLEASPKLQSLYTQHQVLLTQLQQSATQALQQYLTTPKPELQDPLLQEQTYLQNLQQSVNTIYTLHVLETRQQMLNQLQSQFGQLRNRVIVQLRQYDRLQTEFSLATQTWQQYVGELEALKKQTPEPQLVWAIAAAPEVMKDQAGQPVSIQSSELPWEIGVGATVGIALSIGTATLMNRNKGKLVTQQPQSIWALAEGHRLPTDLKPVHSEDPAELFEIESIEIGQFPESVAAS